MQTRPGDLHDKRRFRCIQNVLISKGKGVSREIIPEQGLRSLSDKPLWLRIGFCIASVLLFSTRRIKRTLDHVRLPRLSSRPLRVAHQHRRPLSKSRARVCYRPIGGECERFLASAL